MRRERPNAHRLSACALACGALLAVASAAAPAQAAPAAPSPSVTATASKHDVTLGETFEVELRAEGPSGARFSFPEQAGDESVDLRQAPPANASPAPTAGPAGSSAVQRYVAAAFALGDVAVPAVKVECRLADGTRSTLETKPVPLRVLSVLPKDPQQQKLSDIRGPLAVSVGTAFWIVIGLLALLLAAAAAWLVHRRRRGAPGLVAAEPEAPPDARALQALDRLAASERLARGDYRGYYIELLEIAKGYLERRLSAPVLEMTSSETTAFLREHAHGSLLLPTLRELMPAADRIKFARGDGALEEARRHLEAVRALVGALEERLRPRTDAAAEQVA